MMVLPEASRSVEDAINDTAIPLDHNISSIRRADDTNEHSARPYSVFSKSTKRWIVCCVALAGFFSPLSANIYFPALEYLARDLRVSLELINLTVTAYLICQGIVPFLIGDAADAIGRRPVYIVAFIVYLAANIGLALQDSYPALVVLRILQSSGASGTIALAIGVVADIAPPHARGTYVGAALCGPNTAPSLGPVLGGVLAERASWRWIFWFLSISSGFCLLCILFFLPETARKVVGNGSMPSRGLNRSLLSYMTNSKATYLVESRPLKPRLRMPNPISCLRIVVQKDTALVLIANAVFYVNYSCMQTSLSPLLMNLYGLNALEAGLTYLPYGLACGAASFLVGKVMDRDYRITAAAAGFAVDKGKGDDLTAFPIEKARLRSIWYYVSVSIVCTVGYGWTLEAKAHLAGPLILLFVCGLSVTGTFNVCNTLIVDLHPEYPATASAAVSITRCSAAAVGVSVLQFLLDALGPGWTFTLFGALGASTLPLLWADYRWGMQWRSERLGKHKKKSRRTVMQAEMEKDGISA